MKQIMLKKMDYTLEFHEGIKEKDREYVVSSIKKFLKRYA